MIGSINLFSEIHMGCIPDRHLGLYSLIFGPLRFDRQYCKSWMVCLIKDGFIYVSENVKQTLQDCDFTTLLFFFSCCPPSVKTTFQRDVNTKRKEIFFIFGCETVISHKFPLLTMHLIFIRINQLYYISLLYTIK